MLFSSGRTIITERDAKLRINRALRPYLHNLKDIRGDYHVVDQCRSLISFFDVDLERLGRELGVIRPSETVDMSSRSRLAPYSPTRRSHFNSWVIAVNNHRRHIIDRHVIDRLCQLVKIDVEVLR